MVAKAEELGVTILTKTPAADLILDNGKVVGIYAKKMMIAICRSIVKQSSWQQVDMLTILR